MVHQTNQIFLLDKHQKKLKEKSAGFNKKKRTCVTINYTTTTTTKKEQTKFIKDVTHCQSCTVK